MGNTHTTSHESVYRNGIKSPTKAKTKENKKSLILIFNPDLNFFLNYFYFKRR